MDTSLLIGIISSATAIFVGAASVTSSIVAAKISSRQKANEDLIKSINEKNASLKEENQFLREKENKYLDIIKEWTNKPKKNIKQEIEQEIQNH